MKESDDVAKNDQPKRSWKLFIIHSTPAARCGGRAKHPYYQLWCRRSLHVSGQVYPAAPKCAAAPVLSNDIRTGCHLSVVFSPRTIRAFDEECRWSRLPVVVTVIFLMLNGICRISILIIRRTLSVQLGLTTPAALMEPISKAAR